MVAESGYEGRPLDTLPYDRKLEILCANEKLLLTYHEVQNSKNKGYNEVKAMRMIGLTQSYYMFDSQFYSKSKSALNELHDY